MPSTLIPLKPEDAARRITAGKAVLVDVREPDEFARLHVRGAVSRPLSTFDDRPVPSDPAREVIFTCRTGMRTGANCDRLASGLDRPAYVLEGGLDAWTAAGLPAEADRKAPLEMMRQVQIGAGGLVLAGVVLGVAVHPGLLAIAAFAGAGLLFAGVTGFCGMAKLLAKAPWNRRAA